MSQPPPSAEEQLAFLAKLQRLFSEGDFSSTYKFALLIGLADLAVENGSDTGAGLELTIRQIAERFIQMYWRHAVSYGVGRADASPGVLCQNAGAQAVVVAAIAQFRARIAVASPQLAASHPDYQLLLATVAKVVSAQPLTYLQNFGGSTHEFIYERAAPGRVRLKPGVAYCLRRFQPLVQQLARVQWLDHIRLNRRNRLILGDADDLEQFLFETSRQSLAAMGAALRKLEGGKCFYCGLGMATSDVDHFIPFSQYPRDLAHNFVLAHAGCNRSKSDMLAAKVHLERWLYRLAKCSEQITEVGLAAGVVADAAVCRRVAGWGYAGASVSGASAWVASRCFERVDASYLNLIETAT